MKLCSAWLIYWGRQMGMSKNEVLSTRMGEMLDMLDCNAITHGSAHQKKGKVQMSFDEAMKLR